MGTRSSIQCPGIRVDRRFSLLPERTVVMNEQTQVRQTSLNKRQELVGGIHFSERKPIQQRQGEATRYIVNGDIFLALGMRKA